MFVLVTYDVNTETSEGKARLRKVAKQCVNYGQRVQNSVFEFQIDMATWKQVKAVLEKIIDQTVDSLRYYYLGDRFQNKREHVGACPKYDMSDPLIF